MRLWISLPLAALALNACQPMGSTSSASQAPRVPTLVQGVCGDCHAVQRPFQSPNPDAPMSSAAVIRVRSMRIRLLKIGAIIKMI